MPEQNSKGLHFSPVINVDQTKCCNCHRCIAVCPVKLCNDGSGDFVTLNHDLCIGCGACEAACPQHLNIIDSLKTAWQELN